MMVVASVVVVVPVVASVVVVVPVVASVVVVEARRCPVRGGPGRVRSVTATRASGSGQRPAVAAVARARGPSMR
jgi:hypothetical protein